MSGIVWPAPVPPLRSSQPAAGINDFFKIVGQALQHHIQTEGAPQGTSPTYEETFPKERLSKPDTAFDVILFSVADGRPGATSNDGATVPRAPTVREIARIPDVAGYNRVTFGYWETYIAQFEIWSKSNPNANLLADWFHRFLMRYANSYQFFRAYGIDKFRFVCRLIDMVEERESQELYLRRYQYAFRLERLDTFIERQLTDLTLKVSMNRDTQSYQLTK